MNKRHPQMYINMPVAVYLDGHIYMPVAGKGLKTSILSSSVISSASLLAFQKCRNRYALALINYDYDNTLVIFIYLEGAEGWVGGGGGGVARE